MRFLRTLGALGSPIVDLSLYHVVVGSSQECAFMVFDEGCSEIAKGVDLSLQP